MLIIKFERKKIAKMIAKMIFLINPVFFFIFSPKVTLFPLYARLFINTERLFCYTVAALLLIVTELNRSVTESHTRLNGLRSILILGYSVYLPVIKMVIKTIARRISVNAAIFKTE